MSSAGDDTLCFGALWSYIVAFLLSIWYHMPYLHGQMHRCAARALAVTGTVRNFMPTVREILESCRRELLDLSTRNRLLSMPIKSNSARIIQVDDEIGEQIYRQLVAEKKAMTFKPVGAGASIDGLQQEMTLPNQPGSVDSATGASLPQPDQDDGNDESGVPRRYTDSRLQTRLTSEGLQRRLLGLYQDARTMIEEQGVNILYLALGSLKWYEAEHADSPRFAPLILIPAQLERKNASERFHIRWTEDEIQENISLREKLNKDYRIELPEFPDGDELSPDTYCRNVASTVAGAKGWEVDPNAAVLGFFSFAKFLMYRDLDPENWPEPGRLVEHHIISGLLVNGFPAGEPTLGNDIDLDDVISADKLDHVVDSDSSQTAAIEMVRTGRNLVIQGPPGTGKSQSITNIISTAVLGGKKVLFVAEKLAALQVVKRRLEKEGLGDLCLELHSNKANKRAVIEEIGRTWNLGHPQEHDMAQVAARLEQLRTVLNTHVRGLHERQSPSGLTPFQIMGHLSRLGDKDNQAASLRLHGAEAWQRETFQECRQLIHEIARRISEVGLRANHPWRGICCETVLRIDLEPLRADIEALKAAALHVQRIAQELSTAVLLPSPSSLADIEHLFAIAQNILSSPKLDIQSIGHTIWNGDLEPPRELMRAGRRFSTIAENQDFRGMDGALKQDFRVHREHIAKHGRSWIRLLRSDYRNAISKLKSSLATPLPRQFGKRMDIMDTLIEGQAILREINAKDGVGRSAFGSYWRQQHSDWNHLESIIDWVSRLTQFHLPSNYRESLASIGDFAKLTPLVGGLQIALVAIKENAERVFHVLHLNTATAFAVGETDAIPLPALVARCTDWSTHMEELIRWNNYCALTRRAQSLGIDEIVDKLECADLSPKDACDCFDRAYYGQLARDLVQRKRDLFMFDGSSHSQVVEAFKETDRQRLLLAKYRTLAAHSRSVPPMAADFGATGILMGEMARRRGHRPIRRLLRDAGSVVQAIKPVFMMGPLSVAQFLEPGAVEFDLLVVDEASQVQPVDALGSIARCKQIVVVGDSKQLPPTRFFMRLTSDCDDEDDDESEVQAAQPTDMESVLGLCCARGVPQSMLRWHYRSRHHTLIQVSNHEFYENKLFIVPSPDNASSDSGVKFHHVKQGVYDSGKTRTNRVEAAAVCEAILNHARTCPDLSLGIAAFSVQQRQAILDELELLRRFRSDAELEFFLSRHETEPFFVKNLENVQGDERDVIFISVGYARDVHGYMAMRFGPLSNNGGERRLNVLISRAKKRCEVFASITADDIDLERATRQGVAALKTFLRFAQTGHLGYAAPSGKEEDSPFEEAVKAALESCGFVVHTQVGTAGFFIDLAVLDDSRPGRYLLGIECDGAAYHSARSARDRDRLREQVLVDHGWVIHRIWSTDWFQHPEEQLQKVVKAIENAKRQDNLTSQQPIQRPAPRMQEGEMPARSDHCVERDDGISNLSEPYQVAQFETAGHTNIASVVYRIAKSESPIHVDELVKRASDLCGFHHVGARIRDSVMNAITTLVKEEKCSEEGSFILVPSQRIRIRSREHVSSSTLRNPEMLPPAEIREAVNALLHVSHGARKDELCIAVARIFGFRSTSRILRDVIEKQIAIMLESGALEETNGALKSRNSGQGMASR